jgi:ribosomal protein S18 acetylase RimI-like enzyme
VSVLRQRRADRRSRFAPELNLRVRTGTGADWAFVRDLGHRTASSSVASVRTAPEPFVTEAFDRLLETVRAQSHVLLVAERDSRPAGFLLLLDALPDDVTAMPQAFVAYMAVEAAQRHTGVGSALLQAAEREAIQRGLPYIALMVTEDNDAARSLYAAGGYVTECRLLSKRL